ncbi:MAG: hypothetical protein CMI90_06295 [Pelagibacteraceae bacterium]|nr:hypothetical protein [Pelagibacteraceae bacterium]
MKYIIFNWKSYLNGKESFSLAKSLNKLKFSKKYKIIISPSSYSLFALKNNFKKIELSSQNFDTLGSGGYTSFLPIENLSNFSIKYSLIGHSEVRKYRNENDLIVKSKLILANEYKINPIICIGEDFKTYKNNKTKSYIKNQIKKIFNKQIKYQNLFIAYEPLWSIGSGLVPSNQEIIKIIEYIRFLLKDYSFKKLKILYGGSVNSSNFEELNEIKELDGFLVGSASIKKSFIKIFCN